MKKKLTSIIILLSFASIFFYLGFEPEPYEIDVSGTFFGYNFQTSQYTLYGLFILLFLFLFIILQFFVSIKTIYNNIIYFFTGRSKDKAINNLLNAYAYIVGKNPKSAFIYLKKAERYFKESEHVSIIKLLIEHSKKSDRPPSQEIAQIEKNKTLSSVGLYIESLFPVNDKDIARKIELLKKSGNYAQSLPVLYQYLTLLIQDNQLNEAENALKSARSILADSEYKYHLSFILLLKSNQAHLDKDINKMLALALDSLKHYKNPIALQNVIQAYKILQRDNKALRLLSDYFTQEPTINVVRLFIEFKGIEMPEAMAKRIATLPRTHQSSEGFIALQSYHFAVARDFISLNTMINNATQYKDSLWLKAAQLCIAVEKDPLLLTEALILFKETFNAHSHQEFMDIFNNHNLGKVYHDILFDQESVPKMNVDKITCMLELFKKLLKTVPVTHFNHVTPTSENINLQQDALYRIEGNLHKK